ncbi:diguanylate cyclase [Methylobacterium sp. NPDC080182]|uniref:GGDEF domain-containing protein n=1 Tax=Methylobacterium sp. NPDC080182 TaxID=3390590 RepID=UPI003CFD5B0C
MAGAINTIAVATVAYLRSGHLAFAAIALADLLLLGVRVTLLRRTNTPSGPIFATGLLWASLQGATIALVVTMADVAMSIVALASGLASIGGIIGRNFTARRYAMMQVLIIDLSYKIAFSIDHPEFLPLILTQTLMFVFMNWSILSQHRMATIQAIRGEVESRRQSVTDPLTGLVNRRGLEEAFDALSTAAQRRTLFYLDLDGFKQVNDRLGHAAGDKVLREVARRLRETVGRHDTVSRLGGDEFLVLTGRTDRQEAYQLGERIIEAIALPYCIGDGVSANIGVSIGIEISGIEFSGGLPEMMLRADRALYASKISGKGRCTLFNNLETAFGTAT